MLFVKLCGSVGGGQAEHDTEARPILVSTSESLVGEVNACLKKRLAVLPTRDTALEAVKKGFAVVCKVRGGGGERERERERGEERERERAREQDLHPASVSLLWVDCCLCRTFRVKGDTQREPPESLRRTQR